jgi:hypothetical protein
MRYYEVRVIVSRMGEWTPGDLIWRGRSAVRAKEIACEHAWDSDLGTCIVAVEDGRPVEIDWGDRTERVG